MSESTSHSPQGFSTHPRHFIICGVLIVITTLVLKFLLDWALPLPLQASVEAVTIDWMFGLHVWLIAFLFALVSVFMVYAIVVFRRRDGDDGDGEHFEGNTKLEIGWTLAPMIFVIIFSYLGLTSMWDVTEPKDDELVVIAEGVQWGWNFYYPETANEGPTDENVALDGVLVLPVDQPILVKLRSNNVMHAFWVPEFRVKADVMPYTIYPESDDEHGGEHPIEKMNEVRFTPTIVGDYTLRCAELCGLNHYDMLADVHIVERAEYDEWRLANFGDGSDALVDSSK